MLKRIISFLVFEVSEKPLKFGQRPLDCHQILERLHRFFRRASNPCNLIFSAVGGSASGGNRCNHKEIFFQSSLFILLFLNPLFAASRENAIQIKGSDTMVNLGQAWAEKYMEENPDELLAVTGGGSGTGLSGLLSGTCDIAMSSRNIKEKEIALAKQKGINPYEIKAALDGLAVIVNPKNPVGKLTLDQLAEIFTGKISNWKEAGGPDLKIVLLSREVNSGTHVYFKEHVLRKGDPNSKEEFAPSALLLPSSQAIADEVAGNLSAIGYYGMGYISSKQKPITVAKDKDSEYETPSIQNVVNGKYPISRPLFLYTNGEAQGLIKKFIDFCLSKEGQEIVLKTDFVPINN